MSHRIVGATLATCPTTLPRHTIIETPDIAALLDAAARLHLGSAVDILIEHAEQPRRTTPVTIAEGVVLGIVASDRERP